MQTKFKSGLLALGISIALSSSALAGGAFDFLDPCIRARNEFSDQRSAVRARVAQAEATIATMKATPEFKVAWEKQKRLDSRPYFDSEIGPKLQKMGAVDMDKAFNMWFDDMLASVAPEELNDIIDQNYRELAKQEIAEIRAKNETDFESAKSDLDASCKRDVGSQVLRVTLAPLGWIDGNFKAAKDEHNVVTQVFHAVTGISAKDIAKYGLLGGENSELRKLANAVAGGENSEVRKTLRFFDPGNTGGIFGGANSFFRKPFG
jgi:hypothetical protein